MSPEDFPVRDPTLAVQLSRRIHGIVQTQLIFVAARLAIADCIKDSGKSIKELAQLTGTVEDRLYRLMRALASIGIFVESSHRYFEMTPLAKPLQTDYPDSVRDLAIMVGSEWHVRSWGNILHGVQKEASAFEEVFGAKLFDYFEAHRVEAAVFDNAMTFTSQKQSEAICHSYDFSTATTLVDVGGGHGFLLSTILKKYSTPRAILLERPSVVEEAHRLIQSEGVEQRCQVVAGDFFVDVPTGGDVYILKYIMHNWDDADAAMILRNCRDAMCQGGRVLVVDAIMPVNAAPFEKTSSDIEMMVMLPNGRERTEAEFSELFSVAGLTLERIIPTRSGLSILEGVPVV